MDYRGDPRVLPPEQYCREMARRIADPAASRSYTELAKSMTASDARLAQFVRAGTAFTLADGRIVPATDASQANQAVLSAKAAYGTGTACDSPKFRSWLEGRCKALGMNAPEWPAADSKGTAGGKPGLGPTTSGGSSARAGAPPYGARPADARIAPYDGRSATAGKSLAKAADPVIIYLRTAS